MTQQQGLGLTSGVRRLAVLFLLCLTALCLPVGGAIGRLAAAPLAVNLPPGATLLRQQDSALGTLMLPIGPAAATTGQAGGLAGSVVPSRVLEGEISRRSWRILGDATTLQVFEFLRGQLFALGFSETFACAARQCGGFSFRFGIDVIAAPDMRVNLNEYQFLAAERGEAAVALLASRSGEAVYVQILERHAPQAAPWSPFAPGAEADPPKPAAAPLPVSGTPAPGGLGATEPEDPAGEQAAAASGAGELAATLSRHGHAVLGDLEFATGRADMGPGPFASLRALAQFLEQSPDRRIMLVGHTDNIGSLEGNRALSRRRAASVRLRLAQAYGIAGSRVLIEGAGFVAPLFSNETPEGRERNRRVEAVMLP